MKLARQVVLATSLLLVFTAHARGQEDLDAAVAPSADAGPRPPADAGVSVEGEEIDAVDTPPAAETAEDGLSQLAGSPCAVEDIRNLAAYRAGPAATGAKISGYTIRPSGDLLESEKVLRPVLDSMIMGQVYDEKRERCLVGLLTKLSYRLDGPIRGQQKDGGWWLTLPIHPAVVVRSVSFDDYYPKPARGFFDYVWYDVRSYVFQPILRSELAVHTKLRAGLILPDDEETRGHLLAAEARELEAWLGRQGLFDAEVKVATYFGDREHEVRLVVTVLAGHSFRVGNVRVVGNKAIPRERIVEIFQAKDSLVCWFGYQCRFSKDKLNKDVERLRRLYQGVGFPAVRVTTDFDPTTSPDRTRRKVDFTVNIKEGRRLEYLFEGNDWADKDELESELTFDENGAADDEEAQSSADAVRNFYQRNGFFQALVTWTRITRVPRVFDRLVFGVVEGPRLRVASVTYKGNTSISTARLDSATVTTTWRRYSDGGYLTTRQLTQDAESIREVYLAEGFSEVVVTPRAAMRPELLDAPGALAAASTGASGDGELYVRFDIEEGERDVVSAVDFVGNSAFSAAELGGRIRLAPGKPYSTALLADDLEALKTFYAGRGYAYVEIEAAAPRDEHRFRPRFTITEGKQIRAGKVVARGNFVTRRWVIRTVLGLDEDEVVTVEGLRTGQEALRSSGLFQSVNLELIGLTPEQRWERVHALVTVQERYDDLFSFEANGGYSDIAHYFVGGGAEVMNIGGIGLSLEATGQVGTNGYLNVQFTGRAPWWIARRFLRLPARFSPDVSLTYNLREEIHPRFGDLEQKIWILTLSRQITRRWFASLRGEWAQKDLFEDLVRGPGATEELEQTPIDFDIATFGATVSYDARTDRNGNPTPIGATDGWKLTLYGELATDVFLGSENFVKAGGAFVKPTSFGKGRGVFTFGLRHDYGYPLDGTVLPETERFFAGGDLTLRGYEEGRAFTEIIRSPLPGGGQVITVEEAGGNLRTLANFDLEIRVCNCIGGLPLATALFVDSGVVSNSWNELRGGDAWEPFFTERVRYSVGVALARIITPVISASLEYAIPINPGIGDDQTGRVHINFGFVVN